VWDRVRVGYMERASMYVRRCVRSAASTMLVTEVRVSGCGVS
jgi:hypothetical protein